MLACPVGRGGTAGWRDSLCSVASSRPSATRGQRTSIQKPEDASHPLLHFPRLVLLLCPAECLKRPLLPPVIQSSRLNFGKPAKAQSHCRCCLSSVRDVWISFLPVTEMTPFPLIKGRRCQECDVNFPAKQHNYSEVTMRKREPRSRTIKKVAFLSVTEFLIIYLIRCQGCIFFGRRVVCVCGGG